MQKGEIEDPKIKRLTPSPTGDLAKIGTMSQTPSPLSGAGKGLVWVTEPQRRSEVA